MLLTLCQFPNCVCAFWEYINFNGHSIGTRIVLGRCVDANISKALKSFICSAENWWNGKHIWTVTWVSGFIHCAGNLSYWCPVPTLSNEVWELNKEVSPLHGRQQSQCSWTGTVKSTYSSTTRKGLACTMKYDKADWDYNKIIKKRKMLGKKGAIFNNYKHLKTTRY